MSKRPKLLFLARPFPPVGSIACIRTGNVAMYLARLGWDVTVVTPRLSVWRYVENRVETVATLERGGLRRILTDHRLRCLAPDYLNCWNQGLGWFTGGAFRKIARCLGIDNGIGWIKAAERACSTLSPNDVDVILATGSPFAAFTLAKTLSDRLGRPYVLDYRDLWTENPLSGHPTLGSVIKKEAKLLAGCAAATIVSRSWALAMDNRFGLGSKLHVVTNGYDPEELVKVIPHYFGHFAIVYAGNFYPPKLVISPIMEALKRLKAIPKGRECGKWYFHYYGGGGNHVRQEAERFGVMDKVTLHGRVSRCEALSAVRGAGVAIVIASVLEEGTLADKGTTPGKVFEAMGLGTPILLIAPFGSDAREVAETTGLARSFTGNDIDGMTSFLTDAMCGRPAEPRDLEVYAWTNLATKMDHILRAAAGMDPWKDGKPSNYKPNA